GHAVRGDRLGSRARARPEGLEAPGGRRLRRRGRARTGSARPPGAGRSPRAPRGHGAAAGDGAGGRARPEGAGRHRMGDPRRLFGTDGVRGTANVEPMTSETALRLGRALAHVSKRSPHRHKILIGKDTRLSGYMLETAMASGICSMGVDVLL